jgi:hypothetical protein
MEFFLVQHVFALTFSAALRKQSSQYFMVFSHRNGLQNKESFGGDENNKGEERGKGS